MNKDRWPTKPADLVAGLFFDQMSARDAIADLKIAGLRAGQIGVALSKRGKLELTKSVPCEIGANGMLILVDAGDRCDEIESILERNRGMSRTVMATERSKITS